MPYSTAASNSFVTSPIQNLHILSTKDPHSNTHSHQPNLLFCILKFSIPKRTSTGTSNRSCTEETGFELDDMERGKHYKNSARRDTATKADNSPILNAYNFVAKYSLLPLNGIAED